jgi:hypothetical protein
MYIARIIPEGVVGRVRSGARGALLEPLAALRELAEHDPGRARRPFTNESVMQIERPVCSMPSAGAPVLASRRRRSMSRRTGRRFAKRLAKRCESRRFRSKRPGRMSAAGFAGRCCLSRRSRASLRPRALNRTILLSVSFRQTSKSSSVRWSGEITVGRIARQVGGPAGLPRDAASSVFVQIKPDSARIWPRRQRELSRGRGTERECFPCKVSVLKRSR